MNINAIINKAENKEAKNIAAPAIACAFINNPEINNEKPNMTGFKPGGTGSI